MELNYRFVYMGVVSLVALLLGLIVPLLINRYEAAKRRRIEKLKGFAAVSTDSPVRSQRKKAIETAVDSVGGRFSIIKRIVVLTIFFIWLLFVSFPYLGKVPAAVISIVVSAFGVLLGIIARPVIENVIAGIIISFSKMFRIGDVVLIDERFGTIEDITMTHCIIKLWDWRRYILPNSRMMSKDVMNYTLNDSYIWAHVEFFVSPDANVALVEEIAVEVASTHFQEKRFEDPQFWIMGMEKDAVCCWVAAWAKNPSDAWLLRSEIRTDLLKALQKAGIKTQLARLSIEEKA